MQNLYFFDDRVCERTCLFLGGKEFIEIIWRELIKVFAHNVATTISLPPAAASNVCDDDDGEADGAAAKVF